MKIAILGLSITSSWGNGHATTWRGLVRELAARGHEVTFLERDVPWYAQNRDLANPPYCGTELYSTLGDLFSRYEEIVSKSDLTIVGSYVPDGVAVGDWVLGTAGGLTAFYDIDTPVTIGKLERGDYEYLHPAQIPRYDLYLSFTGGPMLRRLEHFWGARRAHALYCSFDPDLYFPESIPEEWALGYLGTYSPDRQPSLDEFLCRVAESRPEERFAVAGPLYPAEIEWPRNVQRFEHLSPDLHRRFYNSQRATLNITRADMIRAGYSPSVRLFEAAACGTPIISDYWPGIEDFFLPDREILIARRAEDVRRCLSLPSSVLQGIGIAARTRVMKCHSAARRAADLELFVLSYTFHENHSDFRKKQIIPSGAK
ncbi:MAG TPA: glycosyltransferase [Bryobacteraceae bacterium]|nr:glycosyltransferase [Bryobacteraceae bacterium]